jgi:hypothetical protein
MGRHYSQPARYRREIRAVDGPFSFQMGLACFAARHEYAPGRADVLACFGIKVEITVSPSKSRVFRGAQWLLPIDETRKRGFKKTVGFLSGTLAWLHFWSGAAAVSR